MLPLHGAIMHELSGLEEEESPQLTSSSGERLRVAGAVKHEVRSSFYPLFLGDASSFLFDRNTKLLHPYSQETVF